MKKAVIFLTLVLSAITTFGQTHKLESENSKLTITGTSTVHDWEAIVEEFSGSAKISTENGALTGIHDLNFAAEVKSIKSGKGGMDKKIYGALNDKKHKEIIFKATEINAADGKAIATGNLSISGVTKTVQVSATYTIQPDGSILFTGSYPMKMTDFGVDPPTAVFGTIKSGNEIAINFQTIFR